MPERFARLAAMALAILGVAVLIGAALTADVQPDADAYWLAAERLRDGEPLYGGPRGDETEIYRYAPWFAVAWVPLTYVGQDAAYLIWRGLLLLATAAAVWPLLKRPTPAGLTLAVLMGGLLVSNLPAANVTPLIVGMLVAGLRTRLGPIVLGVAASLKLFPLVLVAGFVAERRWRAAAIAAAVAAALWTTVLAFGVERFLELGGPSFYLGGVSTYSVLPGLWALLAASLGLTLVVLVVRRSRWAWLAAAAAIPAAVPRVWLPDAAYVLAGIHEADEPSGERDG
jgi:hypothetical protein